MGIIHVFDSVVQDASTVLAILKDNISTLKVDMPGLKEVFCRSDNAGCYHCAQTILSLPHISKETGVLIARYDYSDVQYGKGAADRLAAKTKQHVRQYLSSGHNVTSAAEFVEGTRTMTGTVVKYGEIHMTSGTTGTSRKLKWPGVSKFYNFQFTTDGDHVIVQKAYKVGAGIRMQLSQLNPELFACVSQFVPAPDQSNLTEIAPWQSVKFAVIPEEQSTTGPILCSEDGCLGSFQHDCELEEHLLGSQHKYQPERETMSDMATKIYAEKQDTLVLKLSRDLFIPEQVAQGCISEEVNKEFSQTDFGWALKSARTAPRFSDDQRSFMREVWLEGERTHLKSNATTVAQEMRQKTTSSGEKRFSKNEWLTAQQISRFWSGLTRRKELPSEGPDPSAKACAVSTGEDEDILEANETFLNEELEDRIAETIEQVLLQAQEQASSALFGEVVASETEAPDTSDAEKKKRSRSKHTPGPSGDTPKGKKDRRHSSSSSSDGGPDRCSSGTSFGDLANYISTKVALCCLFMFFTINFEVLVKSQGSNQLQRLLERKVRSSNNVSLLVAGVAKLMEGQPLPMH